MSITTAPLSSNRLFIIRTINCVAANRARRFVEFNLLVPGIPLVAAAHELCDQLEAAIERRLNKLR